MNAVSTSSTPSRSSIAEKVLIGLLLVLCAPLGVYRLWRKRTGVLALSCYGAVGLPVFLVSYTFIAIVLFAALLPELDLSVSAAAPRTVRFAQGHYESTFLATARDTGGAHELIRVQIEPKGGNSPHYHRRFEETFTVLEGRLTVQLPGKSLTLNAGQSATARRGEMHWFHNPGDSVTVMTVKVTPARGLEKSIRAAYGLDGAGKWKTGSRMQNIWRAVLLMGYSESFVPGIPQVIQEPLVNALAKIAQWLDKDEEMQVFFR